MEPATPPFPQGRPRQFRSTVHGTVFAGRDRHLETMHDGDRVVLIPDPTVATHLYRIAQEAINNALKHSHSKRIEIQLRRNHGKIELSVRDFGSGLPEPKTASGLGMQTMRHRADTIGAQLVLDNAPEGGALMVCALHQTWSSNSSPTAESQKPI